MFRCVIVFCILFSITGLVYGQTNTPTDTPTIVLSQDESTSQKLKLINEAIGQEQNKSSLADQLKVIATAIPAKGVNTTEQSAAEAFKRISE